MNLVHPRRLGLVDLRPTVFDLQRRHDGSSLAANIRLPSHSASMCVGKVLLGKASLQDSFIPSSHTRPITLGSPITYGLEKLFKILSDLGRRKNF